MAKINLLPPDLGPNASVLKALNLVKKLAVVFSIVFFVFGILLVSYILFLRIKIQASVKRSDGYKSSIVNLKSTEQSLYLLKERIGNIKKLLGSKTKINPLSDSNSLFLNHPGITLTQVVTSLDKITVSGNSQSTSSINSFFENIISNNLYPNIKLTSFLFSPKAGYLFNLDINLK